MSYGSPLKRQDLELIDIESGILGEDDTMFSNRMSSCSFPCLAKQSADQLTSAGKMKKPSSNSPG